MSETEPVRQGPASTASKAFCPWHIPPPFCAHGPAPVSPQTSTELLPVRHSGSVHPSPGTGASGEPQPGGLAGKSHLLSFLSPFGLAGKAGGGEQGPGLRRCSISPLLDQRLCCTSETPALSCAEAAPFLQRINQHF